MAVAHPERGAFSSPERRLRDLPRSDAPLSFLKNTHSPPLPLTVFHAVRQCSMLLKHKGAPFTVIEVTRVFVLRNARALNLKGVADTKAIRLFVVFLPLQTHVTLDTEQFLV